MLHTAPAEDLSVEQRVVRRLPEIYLVCALFVTLFLAVLTPPFFVPDEANHSLRELQIAHGHLLAEGAAGTAGGEVDSNVYAATSRIDTILAVEVQRYPMARSRPDGRISRSDLEAVQQLSWAHNDRFAAFPNTAVYPPPLYLPQAAGWLVAEHAGLSIVHGLLLARLCAGLVAVLAGWLALRYAVCSRTQVFLLLLLPTCLSLNASTSQDAVLFGTAALAAACLGRPLRDRRAFRLGELVTTAALLTVCIGARVPYLPLLLVLFLPALNFAVFERKMLIQPAVAAVCGTLLVGVWQMLVRPLGFQVAVDADPVRQAALLRLHPLFGGLLLAKSTVAGSAFIVLKGLALLGTNDATPPLPVYGVMLVAIASILLLNAGGCLRTHRARFVLLVALAGSAAGMSLAEYLTWSVPGAGAVAGLQARYYLPLLLLLTVGLPALPLVRGTERVRQVVLAAACVVFLGCVLTLPLLAAHRFYDSGVVAALHEVLQ